MVIDLIVAIGLAINAFGALALGVPDLPRTQRFRIRRMTPVIRNRHAAAIQFKELDRTDVSDFEEIAGLMRTVWPAVRDHDNEGKLADFNSHNFGYDSQRNPSIILESDRRLAMSSISRITHDFIDKQYRTLGWLFLAIGFGIQFIGTIL